MLNKELTFDRVVALTDKRSLSAGEDYFRHGAVRNIAVLENKITATVQGTERYRVRITVQPGDIDYECSCPYYEDHEVFCKHCVAVSLAYLREYGDEVADAPGAKKIRRKGSMDSLKAWLDEQSVSTLVGMILDHAMEDAEWQSRLSMRLASDTKKGVDKSALKKAIREATAIVEDHGYDEDMTFAGDIEGVMDTLRRMLGAGKGEVVQELALYGVERVEKALAEYEDYEGDISDAGKDFVELHRDACVQSPPDPESLAQLLYERELGDTNGLWEDTPSFYAEALGKAGIAAFRRLLESDWERVPFRGTEEKERASYEPRRYTITYLMESLARADGDIDALITVLRRDLSNAVQFLRIAAALEQAGRAEEARKWAENGVAHFGRNANRQLMDFLVESYRATSDHDLALDILWERFRNAPGPDTYRELRAYTEPIGGWQAWRENAIELIQKKIAEEKANPKHNTNPWSRPDPMAERLIAIYLWENDAESAWRVAQHEGTSDTLWKQIAFVREEAHPDDSLAVYQRLLPPMIEPIANGKYEEPVALVKRVRDVLHRLGRAEESREYVAGLRAAFKRKRNFQILLDELGL